MSKKKERLIVTIRKHSPSWFGVILGGSILVLDLILLYLAIEGSSVVLGVIGTIVLIVTLNFLNQVYFVYENEVLEVKRARA